MRGISYHRETVTYLDRDIDVTYDYQPAEESTNTSEGVDILSIKYQGRDVTRMVNRWEVENIVLEKIKY